MDLPCPPFSGVAQHDGILWCFVAQYANMRNMERPKAIQRFYAQQNQLA